MGESSIISPDLIRDTFEKVSLIRQCLLMVKIRQKSYADVRHRPLEFEVGDHVFFTVMPKRGVVRFGKHGKLSLRFIGLFEILERVGTITYRLALPPSMSGVHEVFHVTMLRWYTPDPTRVVDWGEVEVDTDGTFKEGLECIMDIRDGFVTQDREASEGVMAAPWSGGVNVGARGHDVDHLSLLI